MSTAFFLLIQFAILAYAFVGGVFLAFSDFIMRALAMTGGHGGVETMQVINREVFRWVFMALFLGLAPVSVIVAAYVGDFQKWIQDNVPTFTQIQERMPYLLKLDVFTSQLRISPTCELAIRLE